VYPEVTITPKVQVRKERLCESPTVSTYLKGVPSQVELRGDKGALRVILGKKRGALISPTKQSMVNRENC
jgi:hypothetical protein